MIVLDTHIWLWWLGDREKLSPSCRELLQKAVTEKSEIVISSISVWEVAMLVRKNRLQLTMPARDWVRKSEGLPFVFFAPMDNTIALRSVDLPGDFHTDPADRLIVATALTMGLPLLTKDKKILEYPHVQTIW